MFVTNARGRLWVCFAHVYAQYWSIQDLDPDVELSALWDGCACHSLFLMDFLYQLSKFVSKQTSLKAQKTMTRHSSSIISAFPYHLGSIFQTPRSGPTWAIAEQDEMYLFLK